MPDSHTDGPRNPEWDAPDAQCVDCGSLEICDADETRCLECNADHKAAAAEYLKDSLEGR